MSSNDLPVEARSDSPLMPAIVPLAAAIATAVSLRALLAALLWKLRGQAAFLVPDSTSYLALSDS